MPRVYIGRRLRRARKRLKLSQMRLAEILGVHWRSIQDWEAERTAVDSFKAKALLDAIAGLARKGRSE